MARPKSHAAALLAGCGSSGANQIQVGAARTYRLAGFPPQTFVPNKPQRLSFAIEQPSGSSLTNYKTGAGPHTGVHLIIVKSDLESIIHRHPPIGAGGLAFLAAGLLWGLAVFGFLADQASKYGVFRWLYTDEPGGGSYIAQRMLASKTEKDAVTGTLLFFRWLSRPRRAR